MLTYTIDATQSRKFTTNILVYEKTKYLKRMSPQTVHDSYNREILYTVLPHQIFRKKVSIRTKKHKY